MPSGTASKFFLKLLVTIPVTPIISGIIVHFMFHFVVSLYINSCILTSLLLLLSSSSSIKQLLGKHGEGAKYTVLSYKATEGVYFKAVSADGWQTGPLSLSITLTVYDQNIKHSA